MKRICSLWCYNALHSHIVNSKPRRASSIMFWQLVYMNDCMHVIDHPVYFSNLSSHAKSESSSKVIDVRRCSSQPKAFASGIRRRNGFKACSKSMSSDDLYASSKYVWLQASKSDMFLRVSQRICQNYVSHGSRSLGAHKRVSQDSMDSGVTLDVLHCGTVDDGRDYENVDISAVSLDNHKLEYFNLLATQNADSNFDLPKQMASAHDLGKTFRCDESLYQKPSDAKRQFSEVVIAPKHTIVSDIKDDDYADSELSETKSALKTNHHEKLNVDGQVQLKKLTQIYGKILIVNSISIARRVVQMLTTKYRDLIHACDTENQPALEKDRYRIRQAFIAGPGNSLIVADYGQLELRLLAHLANCKSMLDAFEAGGDFHSRTAVNMYDYIQEAVLQKRVFLEWNPQPGEEKPPVPLLKDMFAAERRKAKMLNFSVAYGKRPVGLSRDWKVSIEAARETVKLWYKERQEVQKWQQERKKEALENRCVYTLLGRSRNFPSIHSGSGAQRGHIERAAINTPVQVHDEVMLEGPTDSAEEAKAIVIECMSKPFDGRNILRVDLAVDAKCAQNWYAAK